MTFNPDIPKPNDDLAVSQGDLLTNFGQLNTQFAVNHVPFNDSGSDKGKHKWVSFVEQADDPESLANEYLAYSKDDSGDTELYLRPESNGTVFQATKDGNIYLGLIPFAAVNFDSALTMHSSYGVTSVTQPAGAGRYRVNFTAAAKASLGGSNDYFWSVSGFDNSSNPVISQVSNTSNYATVVTTDYIQFDFKNQNNSLVTGLTRASVICWRFQ